ncbi:hypothetical protein M406DRAFT_65960 [Cryphonectria parasitica EP155]|uniref:Uncharacterized protein n=1 Tax=Cryphonectria parasitica (strain ATCC 38755 / EP155) TaxID=660469 RepID=A0A9P4Y9J2_CRYP1|nr:uncharacterized protein M406DRAFT_65960 [Cryphonectria parasitica EP155]KAF3769464.1 hypothetical protein M406DRAFT_65960 [Cryphonectria parasitica EP155]
MSPRSSPHPSQLLQRFGKALHILPTPATNHEEQQSQQAAVDNENEAKKMLREQPTMASYRSIKNILKSRLTRRAERGERHTDAQHVLSERVQPTRQILYRDVDLGLRRRPYKHVVPIMDLLDKEDRVSKSAVDDARAHDASSAKRDSTYERALDGAIIGCWEGLHYIVEITPAVDAVDGQNPPIGLRPQSSLPRSVLTSSATQATYIGAALSKSPVLDGEVSGRLSWSEDHSATRQPSGESLRQLQTNSSSTKHHSRSGSGATAVTLPSGPEYDSDEGKEPQEGVDKIEATTSPSPSTGTGENDDGRHAQSSPTPRFPGQVRFLGSQPRSYEGRLRYVGSQPQEDPATSTTVLRSDHLWQSDWDQEFAADYLEEYQESQPERQAGQPSFWHNDAYGEVASFDGPLFDEEFTGSVFFLGTFSQESPTEPIHSVGGSQTEVLRKAFEDCRDAVRLARCDAAGKRMSVILEDPEEDSDGDLQSN